jgi:drug/metabolite transporter (DMT)-like permease
MSPSDSRNLTLSWLILILLTLIWGSSFILIKRGLDHFDAGEVGALRMFAASVVLFPLAIRWFRKLTRQQYFYLFIVGFVGSLIPAFLFAKAETGLSSALAGVLNALTPVSVIIIGGFFFNQRFTPRITIGVFIGFVGTVILMLAGANDGSLTLNYYALFVLAATVCYGMNVNVIKYKLHGIPAIPLTAMAFTLILPFAAGYLFLYSDFTTKIAADSTAWISVFYIALLGVIGTAAAMILFNKMIQFISPVFASSVTYLIPIVAVVWGLLDGELLVFLHYFGMLIILVGVYITNRK